MKHKWWTVGGWLTLFVTALLAHEGHAPLPSKGLEVDRAKGRVTLTAPARAALDVATAELGPPPPPAYVLAYATIVPTWTNQVAASSRLAGRLTKLQVRAGDRVAAGTIVAEIESPELLALQTEWLSVHVALRLAEQTVKTLEASGAAIAGQSLLDARSQLAQAQNARSVAQAKWVALGLPIDALKTLLAQETPKLTPVMPIRAPLAGVVTDIGASIGQVVEPGRPLLTVNDLSKVWVKVGVLESDLDRVAAGQPCELRFAAIPNEAFPANIGHVSLALDPETQMASAWVELANPGNGSPRFVPGMFGEARIAQTPAPNTKSIPTSAVVDDGVDRFVFVVGAAAKNADEFLRRSVEVVRTTPMVTEIRSTDLFPGDRVVTRGSHELGGFFSPGTLRLTPTMVRSIGLRFAPVGMQPIAEILDLPARIDVPPDRRGSASAALAGTLESIHVTRDQSVSAGQVVATVFSNELLAMQLDLLKEHLAGQLATQQLADVRGAGTGVPRKRVLELESAVEESRLRRQNLRRRMSILGFSDEQLAALEQRQVVTPILPIRAPQAGAVVHFESMLGRAVKVDEPIVSIHDVGHAWIRGAMAEADWPRVKLQQTVRVRLMNRHELALPGKVVRTTPVVSGDRTAFVWAELGKTPTPIPRHDQLARMTIELGAGTPALAAPIEAVIRDGGVDFVFVALADGSIERRSVTLGRHDDRWVEVRSGLTAATAIAVSAVQELQTAFASVK